MPPPAFVISMALLACRSTARDAPVSVVPQVSGDLMAMGYLEFVEDGEDARSGVTLHNEAESWPGYTIVASRNLRRADLVDIDGDSVHRWFTDGAGYWARTLLMGNGDLVVVGEDEQSGYVQRLSWAGKARWISRIPAHHDVVPLKGGRFGVLLWKERRIPPLDRFFDSRDDVVAILGPRGQVMEQRSVYAMLADAPEVLPLQDADQWVENLQVRDPFHANAVEWMDDEELAAKNPLYSTKNILVSMRNQDAIVIFDWEARKAVWAWGQGELLGPHDATVLPDGHILVFDNGVGRNWSRVVELDPLTKRIVWEYRAREGEAFFTESRGSNQRLPNGNTLIGESDAARVFEVTPDGRMVWEFINPASDGRRATLGRAERVSVEVVRDLWRGLECNGDGSDDDEEDLLAGLMPAQDEQ